jgi:transposase
MKGEKRMEIRNDRKKGLSYVAIGEKHNIDWRTANRYGKSEHKRVYELKEPKPSKLDPYKDHIDLMLEDARYSAVRIGKTAGNVV